MNRTKIHEPWAKPWTINQGLTLSTIRSSCQLISIILSACAHVCWQKSWHVIGGVWIIAIFKVSFSSSHELSKMINNVSYYKFSLVDISVDSSARLRINARSQTNGFASWFIKLRLIQPHIVIFLNLLFKKLRSMRKKIINTQSRKLNINRKTLKLWAAQLKLKTFRFSGLLTRLVIKTLT